MALLAGANVLNTKEIEYVIKKGGKDQFRCPWDKYKDSPYAAQARGDKYWCMKPYKEPRRKGDD